MTLGSLVPVLGSIASSIFKYGAIWLALYFARYIIVAWFVEPFRSYVRLLPGPPTKGLFDSDQLHAFQDTDRTPKLHDECNKLYGKTIRFQGLTYNDQRLITVDPVALNYILNRASDIFPKGWQTRRFIGRLVSGGAHSEGIVVTEGEEHRKLRRIISPAFSHQSVKNLAPLFLHKSFELRDKLRSVLATPQNVSRPGVEVEQFPEEPHPRVRMDMHYWIGRATFDIIGVAGFGYEFRSIQEKDNAFHEAYRCMFDTLRNANALFIFLTLYLPQWLVDCIPNPRTKEIKKCRKIIEAETSALFAKRREEIATEKASGANVDKEFVLLNLLLRSNESNGAQLTEQEIIAQIDSIMFAGHDTTSVAIQWALWELTRYPSVQARLRAELAPLAAILRDFAAADSSEKNAYTDPTGELCDITARLDALPYLDKFVREVLRLHPSVHSTLRVAMRDDIIPVSEPVRNPNGEISKAWVGGQKMGMSGGGIRIRKGEYIQIPIEGMNLLKSVWGDDAHEFNPDRWDNLPATAKATPGLYSNLMTFLVGPRACPATRWAPVEIKIMLAVMIASFEFTGASPMRANNYLVCRPYVENKFELGYRMPLVVAPL